MPNVLVISGTASGTDTLGEQFANEFGLKIERHPAADKLVVCQVDVGFKQVQIITSATNVFEGAIIPVARDGSTLPGGKIKKGKLRGVESAGMLCSLGELGLTVNDFPYAIDDGIFVQAVGTQAVDGFRGNGNQTAMFQNIRCLFNGSCIKCG